jgi:hypothetical protein
MAQVKTVQAVIILDGKVTALAAPMLNERQLNILVSVGDAVDKPHPGAVRGSTLTARFTSIIKTADALELALPTAPEDPAQQDGPDNAVAADGLVTVDAENQANGYERIHWIDNNNGDAPVVVSLPLAIPLPSVREPPSDAKLLTHS